MATMLLPIHEIHLNEDNPRLLKDERFQQLCKSIEDFPQMLELRPIVVDETCTVLGGNMRLRALQHLGYTEVPVVVAQGLTDEQKREFIIKDNGSYGDWNWGALLSPDWNMNATTFSEWTGTDAPRDWMKSDKVAAANEQEEWRGMPEFEQPENPTFRSLIVHFNDQDAVNEFTKLLGVTVTDKTRFFWFPQDE